MFRVWRTGLRSSAAIRHLRGSARSPKSTVIIAAIAAMTASLGSIPTAAQSVTGTGDVVPAVPPPPLPSWDLEGGELAIGDTGKGALTIEGGGLVMNGDGFVGRGSASEGEVTITGAGSEWNNFNLYVGFQGKGALTIANGAKVNVENVASIAQEPGAEGVVTVTGQGSLWSNDDLLVVGFFDNTKATVIVEQGARLESGSTNVANGGTAEGLVVVRGAGSVWDNTEYVAIGINGEAKGTLRIEEGGLVQVGGDIIVANATATGTIAIDSKSRLEGDGAFMQGVNGTYIVGIGDSSAGLIQVDGAAEILAGAKLEAVLGGSAAYRTGDRFKVLDAASVADNAFMLVNAGAVSAFLTIDDSYDVANGDVYIEVTATRSLAEAALTPNQTATAAAAESSDAVAGLFQMLGSDAEARDAFDQASGEVHASVRSMLIGDSYFLRDAVTDRLRAAANGGAETAMAASNGDGRIEPAADPVMAQRPYGVWLSGFGSWGDRDGDGNVAALERSVGGVFAGVDTDMDDWRLGAVAGYSQARFDADDRNSSGSADGYSIGVYAGTMWESIALRAGASYTWNDIETRRKVTNPDVQELNADYGADTVQVFGELAYEADLGNLVLEPFANVAYVDLQTESFEEQGGTLALASKSASTDSVATTLGLRPELRFALGDANARLRGLIGWRHAFGDITPDARLAFAAGDTFTIRGVPLARDAAVIEGGLDVALGPSATLGVSYQGEFGDGVSDNGLTARLGIAF